MPMSAKNSRGAMEVIGVFKSMFGIGMYILILNGVLVVTRQAKGVKVSKRFSLKILRCCYRLG